ncbi:MAG: hypothetical protein JRE71_20145 [Deltaproteobacteria bacterium]|nr:hypothetical protein [Deltaproteobacteria bacterium]
MTRPRQDPRVLVGEAHGNRLLADRESSESGDMRYGCDASAVGREVVAVSNASDTLIDEDPHGDATEWVVA